MRLERRSLRLSTPIRHRRAPGTLLQRQAPATAQTRPATRGGTARLPLPSTAGAGKSPGSSGPREGRLRVSHRDSPPVLALGSAAAASAWRRRRSPFPARPGRAAGGTRHLREGRAPRRLRGNGGARAAPGRALRRGRPPSGRRGGLPAGGVRRPSSPRVPPPRAGNERRRRRGATRARRNRSCGSWRSRSAYGSCSSESSCEYLPDGGRGWWGRLLPDRRLRAPPRLPQLPFIARGTQGRSGARVLPHT